MTDELDKTAETTEPANEAAVASDESDKVQEVESQTKSAEGGPKVVKKKKNRRNVSQGQVHVLATFNNTIITVTDTQGNAVSSASAGSSGFRGSKKGTAYAAQIAAEKAIDTAKSYGLSKVDVFVKGIGMGREAAIRTLVTRQINVDNIKDVTGIPHGGVRKRRAKRN